jgi:hypothetical protein
MFESLKAFEPVTFLAKRNPCRVLLGLLWLACTAPLQAAGAMHHDLQVRIDAEQATLSVEDRIRLPADGPAELRFILADTLEPVVEGAALQPLDHNERARFREYRLIPQGLPGEVRLRYTGSLPAGSRRAEHGMPLAVLGPDGAFLDNASAWYPWFGPAPVTFRLSVELPPGWTAVSQGRRSASAGRVVWEALTPQEDIYLLAGPYRRYAETHRGHELEVYLLDDDPELAARYLRVLGQYLDFYSALLGDYPYPKFAVVENRWQTGYGMPSFTLLGSRVLRLPFILHSSLPHEILHNWWGNGVYLDLSGGNWSEGLTAYLADHLIKEAQGQGAEYRRQALERYANFAAEGRDFPVRAFRARHDDATQAVGYGKTLMLYHMLRRELGDGGFVAALRAFWAQYQFREASFDDLRSVVAQTAGGPVAALAAPWLEQAGAPELRIRALQAEPLPGGDYGLRLELQQIQDGVVYPLRVPVAVQLAGEQLPRRFTLVMDGRDAALEVTLPARPLRVDVDPEFELFRLLDAAERPPALGRLFGARQQWLVLPADAPAEQLAAWRALAEGWQRRYGNVRVVEDRGIDRLPEDAAAWLLGWDNRWLRRVSDRFSGAGQALQPDGLQLRGQAYPATDYAVVGLDPDNGRPPLGLVGAGSAAEIAALARKLPHYGTYGRLVFARPDMDNRLRETLPVARSPLSRVLAEADPGPPPPAGQPLAALAGVPLRFD